ncbi:tetratricopeptide repeat-containing protein [Puia sp. P3]|uniref:tetratricopeptide repeat-containing protein n=1 Tax=Puia sp. P3 TaxID=3423952 RepID=UPI003D678A9A
MRTGDREYKERQYVVTSQAEADLMNLESDMRTGDYPLEELLGRLEAISQETDKRGLRRPCITELEARIYKSLGKYDLATAKYEQLIRSDQGSYSTGAMDLYCNLRSKLLKEQADSCKGDPKFLVAEFDQVDNYLAALLVVSPTTERYNIRGSAWKRRTCLYKADAVGMEEAIRKAAEYYRISHQQKPDAYPWSNWIALENLLVAAGRQEWGAVDTHLPTIQQIQDAIGSLRLLYVAGPRSKIFQEWISPSNLLLANWLVMATQAGAGAKDAYEDQVVASYEDVWEKVGSVEDKLSDIQHLQLLIDALGGLRGPRGIL